MTENQAKFFLLMGPSGSGKGTMEMMFRARHPEFNYALSATTRPMRTEDKEGEIYHFVSSEEFDRLIENDELLEWAWLYNNQQRSGILKQPVVDALEKGISVIREADILGGWPKIMQGPVRDRLRGIFLMPPSIEAIERRIRNRSAISDEKIAGRMATAREEMAVADRAHFQVLAEENQQEKIYEQIEKYILGEIGR